MSNLDPSEQSSGNLGNLLFGKLIEANNNLSNTPDIASNICDEAALNESEREQEINVQTGVLLHDVNPSVSFEGVETLDQRDASDLSSSSNFLASAVLVESENEVTDQLGTPVSNNFEDQPTSVLSDTRNCDETGLPQSLDEDNRPVSASPDSSAVKRKRRQKSKQRLQCVRCCAFDFPNYSAFHNHHLLHAYESFLLVSVKRLPEQEPETVLSNTVEMGTEEEDNDSKRGPIKLTIKLSSFNKNSSSFETTENCDGDANFPNYYAKTDQNSDSNFVSVEAVNSDPPKVEEMYLGRVDLDTSEDFHLVVHDLDGEYPAVSETVSDPLEDKQENVVGAGTVNEVQNGIEALKSPESATVENACHNNDEFDPDVQPLSTTKCTPCMLGFFSSEDLTKHIDNCHGDQQKCCRCERVFDRIEDLIEHVRMDHANELNQEPDPTPVPVQPKAEPLEPKPALKLRVIPSAQLMSSTTNSAETSRSSGIPNSDFGFPLGQDRDFSNVPMHINQNTPPVHPNNPNLTSMMNHMNNMAPGGYAQQMNGVLSSVPGSQSYPPYHNTPMAAVPRMYMNIDPRSQMPPPGAVPVLQAALQKKSGTMVRIPREPVPSSLGVRGQSLRAGTPVQGRGRPLAPLPRSRGPVRSLVPNGMRQTQPAPPGPARKRNSGQPSMAPPEKQSKNDTDDIEVVAVRQRVIPPQSAAERVIPQQSVAESHGLPRLPNSISVSVKTVPAAPEKASDGGSVLASVLANRGITVTPATSEAPQPTNIAVSIAASLGPDVSLSPSTLPVPNRVPPARSNNFVAPLPPGPRQVTEKDRPPRPPTVDLTVDQTQKTYSCQACKRKFSDVQKLKSHLESHINPSAPPSAPNGGGAFICNVCNCPFHSQHALEAHRQLSHPPKLNKVDSLAIPIVDLSDPGVTSRLSQLGIKTCLPVGKLASLGNGSYGIPLVSVDSRTGSSNFPLSSAILTLGSIQKLP